MVRSDLDHTFGAFVRTIGAWWPIETLSFGSSLQQTRYPPTRIAYTAALARSHAATGKPSATAFTVERTSPSNSAWLAGTASR